MVIKTKVEIQSVEYTDAETMVVNRSIGENNTISSFEIVFSNENGQYDNTFSLNNDVIIYADKDASPTTKIFRGIIERLTYTGRQQTERLRITGRDYGAILQDILVSPRIFKDMEVSHIVKALLIQNIVNGEITWTGVNATGTTVERITFNNISVFDALKRLADTSGFYFYIDEDKNFHFVQRDSVSSGLTFDNTNITDAKFRTTDDEIFNNIIVYGDRQFTASREVFGAQAGSMYQLDDKPSNVGVIGSADPNVYLQPGGIISVDDPGTGSVQFLVNYPASQIILTSGTAAGDNTGWIGSKAVIIEYQRSSPLASIRRDDTSISVYGQKDKIVVDRNIKDIYEANTKADTLLSEFKDPKIQGDIDLNGVLAVTPGNTATVNIPFHNIGSETYKILNAKYNFTPRNNLSDNVLSVSLNKKIADMTDITKDILLRLKKIEGSEVETSLTLIETAIDSLSVEVSDYNVISRSIGSGFYFGLPGHNIFNDTDSLYGDMRTGSEVISKP